MPALNSTNISFETLASVRIAKPADCTVHPFCWDETSPDAVCEGCGTQYAEWSVPPAKGSFAGPGPSRS